MNRHPYLRAYVAGIALPTPFLLVAMSVFCVARLLYNVPVPIERMIVFPMAVVPNLWGAWNMLYVAIRRRRRFPIGAHGAILPLVIIPIALLLARALDFRLITPGLALAVAPGAVGVYYLAWKYIVAFFNRLVEAT